MTLSEYTKPATCLSFSRRSLEEYGLARQPSDELDGLQLVGCGEPIDDLRVSVVDPKSLTTCEEGSVGEVWIAGDSVARGYWNDPSDSCKTFTAALSHSEHKWLRTGDLGFYYGGELFITGREKDILIFRGRNIAPQDVEEEAAESHPALRKGCCAAFDLGAPDEFHLGLAVEAKVTDAAATEFELIAAAIRNAVLRGLAVPLSAIAIVEKGMLPKTTSGKIQRQQTREAFLAGKLRTHHMWLSPTYTGIRQQS